MADKKKLIRVTTADISLDRLLKGQLRFLNQYFEIIGVASDTGILKEVGDREGIRVIDIPMHREISIVNDVISLWKLYRFFRKEAPYIVHANTPKGSLLSMIAAWMARIPNRIYLVTGLRYQGASGLFKALLRTMERISCRFATVVIPEGQGVKNTLISDIICKRPSNVLHYGNINGIDIEYFSVDTIKESKGEIRQKMGIMDNDFVFIFIGRIVRDKGMCELVEALRRFDANVKLLLVGNFEPKLDPLPEDVANFLQNDNRVVYVGWQEDVRPYLKAADILVCPSYREGFPNVPIQAGAMGLPSIVTDINGCNEIVINEDNGIIIQPRDANSLYEKMNWLLNNPEEVKKMSDNARKLITSRYDQRDVWQALLNMYESL